MLIIEVQKQQEAIIMLLAKIQTLNVQYHYHPSNMCFTVIVFEFIFEGFALLY